MLTEEVINRLSELSGEEDTTLWAQGDILNDNQITQDEIKRLAVILQQSPTKLYNRQFVAAETPAEYRRSDYSWNLYAVFAKIPERSVRFTTLFARPNWTLAEAKDIVRTYNPPTPALSENKLTKVERASLRVGNVKVDAKLDPKGNLTIRVNLGGDRVCEVTPQSANTKIVFPA